MATPPILIPDKHARTRPGRPVFSQSGPIEVTRGGLVCEAGLADLGRDLAGHVLKVAGTESGTRKDHLHCQTGFDFTIRDPPCTFSLHVFYLLASSSIVELVDSIIGTLS